MENIFAHELSRYSTIIVGNGETPQGEIPLLFLQHARFIVCCDGALEKLLRIGKETKNTAFSLIFSVPPLTSSKNFFGMAKTLKYLNPHGSARKWLGKSRRYGVNI